MENTLVDREGSPSGQPRRAREVNHPSEPSGGARAPAGPSAAPGSAAAPSLSVYSIPRQSEAQEWVTRSVAVVAWLYGLYWIIWRWTETLNWDAPIFSLLLVSAETYGLLTTAALIITVWRLNHRTPLPAPPDLTVDVFITTYDEPLQIVRRTAIGAKAITYPHKTYILDDGRRDEMKAMAEELGIGYIRRENNANAKAGNLNNALKHTSGEFILQLDADHVALPNMLDRLLGFFDDPKVAYAQSPQDFYNTDSFTHVVNDADHRLWEENRIFFSLIQGGKDRHGASFFCGSCGVLRRKAFEEIGGFSTKTVTEDMETSLVLHARGWRSVYCGEMLAYGLAPSSAGQYHVQRLRWGQGSMQILRKLNPLTYPGLSPMQRLQYLTSTTVYFDGYQKLIFYLAPVIFFFTGWLPVRTTDYDLLVRLIPYMLLTYVSFELLSRGTGWIFISERYNMAKFTTYMAAVPALFTKKRLKFNVTPKGTGHVPFYTYGPQLVLFCLSAASLVWGALAFYHGWIDYPVSGWTAAAFFVNAFWICWNLYFSAFVVRKCLLSRQRRADHRFIESFTIQIQPVTNYGARTKPRVAMTQDLNPAGISFRAVYRDEPGTKLDLELPLAAQTIRVRGTVVRVNTHKNRYGCVFEHGVRFDELPVATRDVIEHHCTQHSVPLWRTRYRQSIPVFEHVAGWLKDQRASRRRLVQLPAIVRVRPKGARALVDTGIALLEETSFDGARLIMENPLEPGTPIRYEVPGTSLSGRGTVVFSRAFESPMNVRFAVGVSLDRSPTPATGIDRVLRWRWRSPTQAARGS
jgi:cellulose synthase/poly-beta-1,6-N-acetylglucosamine synthase-like glycosyltransferase